MSKHTPGPWTTYVNEWPDKIVVRSMFPDGTERTQVAVTNAANAQLIAAAPDLLDALMFYMSAFGQHLEFQGQAFDGQQVEADKKARAAIAKATGGEE